MLAPAEPGEFEGSFRTTAAGVYRVRVRARGRTRAGRPFTRERTVTAAVWRGGDDPAVRIAGGGQASTTPCARCCPAC